MGAPVWQWQPRKDNTSGNTRTIDELKRLKERVKRLEALLADANIDLAIERAYTQIACERAGIKDVAEFKKSILADSAPSR
jgi:hypothetical protein